MLERGRGREGGRERERERGRERGREGERGRERERERALMTTTYSPYISITFCLLPNVDTKPALGGPGYTIPVQLWHRELKIKSAPECFSLTKIG